MAAPVIVLLALLVGGCGADAIAGGQVPKAIGNPADRAFVAGVAGEEKAIVAAAHAAENRSGDVDVRSIAGDVLRADRARVAAMLDEDERLKVAGIAIPPHIGRPHVEPAGTGAEPGRARDRRFMSVLRHHLATTVAEARVELRSGSDARLRSLAAALVGDHARRARRVRAWLARQAPVR